MGFYSNQNLSDKMNKFFTVEAQISVSDQDETTSAVRDAMWRIMSNVSANCPLFGKKLIKIGSHWNKLKVGCATEVDFLVPLEVQDWFWESLIDDDINDRFYRLSSNMSQRDVSMRVFLEDSNEAIFEPQEGQTYVRVQGDVTDPYDVLYDDDVIPYRVKALLHNEVKRAVDELGLAFDIGKMDVHQTIRGPSINIDVWVGETKVKVDLVPAILEETVAVKEVAQWPRKGTKWPDKEKKKEIANMHYMLVPKGQYHWARSFVKCEDVLVQNIDSDKGHRKKCYRIMKRLNDLLFSKCTDQQPIDSYMLKNIWFMECEKHWRQSDWVSGKCVQRVLGMAARLVAAEENNYLPCFLDSNVNLLANKSKTKRRLIRECANRVQDFLDDPDKALQEALDMA